MDYIKHYNRLISSRINRKTTDYTETHHILPRSMGGDNSKNNLVELTAREHFIAHLLLYKIHKNSQMACALKLMSRNYTLSSRLFEELRLKVSEHLRENNGGKTEKSRLKARERMLSEQNPMKDPEISKKVGEWLSENNVGERNGFYGKNHSDESKQLIRDTLRNTFKQKTIDNPLWGTRRKIGMFKDGELVEIFYGLGSRAKDMGLNLSSIIGVCRGRIKSHKGFTFKYLDIDIDDV